ncbi:MAG: DNA polymerase/3'-5' exonuclease PolX [Chloroflexi bacterium]|nr:MAG: DNA polymerase/3'-5' exonuclease PolX [Chloroflexota bacterium]
MARTLTNADVAATFELLADLLSIRGDSRFKVDAYRRAAENIAQLPEALAAVRARNQLEQIPGVGKEIAQKIGDLFDTGTFDLLQEVEAQYPPSLAEVLRAPGIGPKKARALYETLGVASLDDLRAALDAGRLSGLAGFGPTSIARLATALRALETAEERMPLGVARRRGLELLEQIRAGAPGLHAIELAGSIRRFRDTIGDIDISAAADDPEAVVEVFLTVPAVADIEMRGPNRGRVRLHSGVSADIWVLPPAHWGALLFHTTGSKYHNIHLRDLANDRGAHLNEYGLTTNGGLMPFASEAELYAAFDMQFIPPPMREDNGEIELALRHELPVVVEQRDLRGDLHMHSTWSDGTATIREMALAAIERGYEYICITDHSGGLAIAHGLDANRLRAQRRDIDEVNAEMAPFRVLHGVETEVRADGSLDLPDDALAALDLVIASVHSSLQQDRERLTQRAVAAIRHPLVDILAHPTGRIVGGRSGGDFDVDALFRAAAEAGTVLEINADPARLDLRDSHARAALAAGCRLHIGSDAHSTAGLDNVFYGIGVAQRAWAGPQHILNTLPLDQLLAALKRNRR